MEYNDLIKQAQQHQKKMMTKEINVCDLLSPLDRDRIAKIIDERVKQEYPIDNEFKWTFSCSGHFIVT